MSLTRLALVLAVGPQHRLVRVDRAQVAVHGLDHCQGRVAEDLRELDRVRATRELPRGERVPKQVRVDRFAMPADSATLRIIWSTPEVVSGS